MITGDWWRISYVGADKKVKPLMIYHNFTRKVEIKSHD